ncbi:MAG: non-canonical purine NTP pyrophosphatase [Candidatus Moranbacteria bacterium]|nr:non-canonical purine NTP pyrophosphatase [Candidatus Moranbacteria bacterium]
MKILIATGNQDKLSQFKRIFENLGSDIELLSLKDVGIFDDVEEDQETLLENAKKKAKFYAEKSGLPSLSDDFGIFVNALDGFPGVSSKRWMKGSDKDRCAALIEKLKKFPKEKWTAKYIGAVALYDPEKKKFWENVNEAEGVVVDEFRGDQFFGYDSIFESKKFGKTFAELGDEEKMFVGHRSLGIKELLRHLSREN